MTRLELVPSREGGKMQLEPEVTGGLVAALVGIGAGLLRMFAVQTDHASRIKATEATIIEAREKIDDVHTRTIRMDSKLDTITQILKD